MRQHWIRRLRWLASGVACYLAIFWMLILRSRSYGWGVVAFTYCGETSHHTYRHPAAERVLYVVFWPAYEAHVLLGIPVGYVYSGTDS